MRARDVILALIIIGAGVFLSYEKSGRLDLLWEDWEGPSFGTFQEYVYEEVQEFPGPVPAELEVLNSHGEVEIIGMETDQTAVVFKKRIFARNQADADGRASELRMIVSESGTKRILSTNRDQFRRKRFSTDFKVTVPVGTAVLIRNSYGPSRTEKTGRTEIVNPHGEVVGRGIQGSLILANSYAAVDVDKVEGDVRLDAPHASVSIRNIGGELSLDHSYGEIEIENIGRKLIVNGNHSRIGVKGLREDAELSSSYRTISVAKAAGVRIRARHCDIETEDLSGILDVIDDYGRVRIVEISGDLKIDGRNLEIDGRGIHSPEIFVQTGYRDVSLAGFSGKTTVSLHHGGLDLAPDPSLAGPIDVQGSYAGIRIQWPSGLRVPFEGRTRDGRITWDLSEPPDSETTNGNTEIKAFGRETGKPGIRIITAHGDIAVSPSAVRRFPLEKERS